MNSSVLSTSVYSPLHGDNRALPDTYTLGIPNHYWNVHGTQESINIRPENDLDTHLAIPILINQSYLARVQPLEMGISGYNMSHSKVDQSNFCAFASTRLGDFHNSIFTTATGVLQSRSKTRESTTAKAAPRQAVVENTMLQELPLVHGQLKRSYFQTLRVQSPAPWCWSK